MHMQLNAEQSSAVQANDGPVVIVAGPGTGKTKTLTARIAFLITERNVPATSILALTFTKKAAGEMQDRVRALLGNKNSMPYIATFHALCLDLLQQEQAAEQLTFIHETDRLALIKQLPRTATFKHLSVRELALTLSVAKNNLAQADDASQTMLARYNQALREKNLLDFDDLLLQVYERLQTNKTFKKRVQARFRYVLVDEFQDTNRLQYYLLRELLSHQNIFVIGDHNQSIYGFRGASSDIFRQFEHDYPNAQKIILQVNYRSHTAIVDLSNAIFPNSPPLSAYRRELGKAQSVQVYNEYAEAAWVLQTIQTRIGGGDMLRAVSNDTRAHQATFRDFAVLYRSRAAALVLQKMMDESGLPYQIVGEGSPYERRDTSQILTLLHALQSGEIPSLKHLTPTQTKALLAQADGSMPPSQLVPRLAELFGLDMSPALVTLSNTLVQFDTLSQALAFLDEIAAQQFYDPSADVITLLTIHASKGLEFDHVFLVGAEEGLLPYAKADPNEEKRLFYVAVTRAKQRLDVLHASQRAGQHAEISRFITDTPYDVLSHIIDPSLAADKRRAQERAIKRSQQTLF